MATTGTYLRISRGSQVVWIFSLSLARCNQRKRFFRFVYNSTPNMKLSPREVDHLVLSQVGLLAQRRLARGTRLSCPEAIALIAHVVMEKARDGMSSVSELMDFGTRLLGKKDT
jgi:urease gamma subunit